jgi:hypothetical protein
LHHEVKGSSLYQAGSGKALGSTFNERKQMSTKTSIKRIALVAVSALGFGLMSVVSAPVANAAFATAQVAQPTAATLTNTNTTLAGRIGQEVSVDILGTVAEQTGNDTPMFTIAARLTSQPSGSAVNLSLTCDAGVTGWENCSPGLYVSETAASTSTVSTSTSSIPAVLTMSEATADADVSAITTAEALGTIKFTPTASGTYIFTVWNEKDHTVPNSTGGAISVDHPYHLLPTPALSGTESYKTFSVIVSAGVANLTVSAVGGSSFVKDGTDGALIKVCTTDTAGDSFFDTIWHRLNRQGQWSGN